MATKRSVALLVSLLWWALVGVAVAPTTTDGRSKALPALKVSRNGRHLVRDGGSRQTPFFWLGDTAWDLLGLSREDVDLYLADRAAKGFTVIQGPVVIRFRRPDGRAQPDGAGELPLGDAADLRTLNEKYLRSVDYVVDKAAALGLYVAPLPMWGMWMERYSADDLYSLGRGLGQRYGSKTNLIWVAGGEAAGETMPARVEALARGLREGSSGRQLMSVHAGGNKSSAAGRYKTDRGEVGEYAYHGSAWLDFNMIQSGHFRDHDTYRIVATDYARAPTKPTFESEFFYEDHPNWPERAQPTPSRGTALDARKGAYWSVFAGGFGFTYGHHAVWQFYRRGDAASNGTPTVEWKEALRAPGAGQLRHLRQLMESRAARPRIPDQSLLVETDNAEPATHVRVTRDGTAGRRDATYVMAYLPTGRAVTLDTSVIAGDRLNVWWYDPRTGASVRLRRRLINRGRFTSPARADGPDWVLVIDDAAARRGDD